MAACFQTDNKSHFHKTICLYEWWLIWADDENREKKLGIAGYTSRCHQALRIFSSAPIAKRYDAVTLGTTDGMYVMINGYINRYLTAENGFPTEVFEHFLFGFPPHWEACAVRFLTQGFASNEARTAEKVLNQETAHNDASLKGCSVANEQNSEITNTGPNASPASSDPKLDQNYTVCMTQDDSKKSATRARIAKNTDWRKIEVVEKETIWKEKTAGEEASTAGKNTCIDVSRDDASLEGCSVANEQNSEMTNTGPNASPASSDPKLDQNYTVCMTQEDSKKSARYITRARIAKNTDWRKIEIVEKETIWKRKTAGEEASTAVKNTCIDVSRDDARLEGCIVANEQNSEMTNTGPNASPARSGPKLNKNYTVCMTQEDSKKSVRYVTRARIAKNMDWRKIEGVEKETIWIEKTAGEEASTAEKNTCIDVSREIASLKLSSIANKEENEKTSIGADVSPGNADPKLDKDHTVCAIQEGSKKSHKTVRYITRSGGAKNTDHKRTAAVEKEEKAATKEEKSTAEKKTKRKLTYVSPVTPEVDEITSVVSPELSSVKKSRSGRLLLPTLEYWRNQMAVYDADHQVIGIKNGISTPSKVEVTREPKKAVDQEVEKILLLQWRRGR